MMISADSKEDIIIPRKASQLTLQDGDAEYLRTLIKQRTIQAQIVIRAHILLDKSNGISTRNIASFYDISPAVTRRFNISDYRRFAAKTFIQIQYHRERSVLLLTARFFRCHPC